MTRVPVASRRLEFLDQLRAAAILFLLVSHFGRAVDGNFNSFETLRTGDKPVSTFQSNESDLIRIAKAAGKTVVLKTVTPDHQSGTRRASAYVAASLTDANLPGIPPSASSTPRWVRVCHGLRCFPL